MNWRPFVRMQIAKTAGDRHWWVRTADGHIVHQWLALHVVENEEGSEILQLIVGPMMLCLAARLGGRA
ncbi:TPA: hypothetical protein ACOENT_000048 [Stenotrophomonas maltophilia]